MTSGFRKTTDLASVLVIVLADPLADRASQKTLLGFLTTGDWRIERLPGELSVDCGQVLP